MSVWSPNMAWNETACNVRLYEGGRPQVVTDTGKSVLQGGAGAASPVEYGKEA